MDETFDEFAKAAQDEFGDGIVIGYIQIDDLKQYNIDMEKYHSGKFPPLPFKPVTEQDLIDWGKQVFPKNGICPKCKKDLNWSFDWGIRNGYGNCSCGLEYKYYHRINDNSPIRCFSLNGF